MADRESFETHLVDTSREVHNGWLSESAPYATQGSDLPRNSNFRNAEMPQIVAAQIFHGRERELSDLVHMFCEPQACAVLMGQGGAGKSSLALALMNQPEIKQRFRHQRLRVKCNSTKGSFDLLSRLGSALGFPDVATETESSGLEVEDLLTELSNIPTVSILLTLRGTQRPLGPAYNKPFPAPLGPLPPDAARQAFFAISDVTDDGEDAPLVDVLVHMVGFLPMPITLLAQLARYEPLPFLIERYREEGTSMLNGGDVSMEESIEATLYSARALGILAQFPEGTPTIEVSALLASGGRLPGAMANKCLSVLHKVSLMVVVPGPRDQDERQQKRVRVPEIVRTYLERHVLDGGRALLKAGRHINAIYIGQPPAEGCKSVGQPLKALRSPAMVIDQSIFQKNCVRILQNAGEWGATLRAHLKYTKYH
ncbi:hypothetical protein B0H13DRAFT_1858787 [Mycena leptocephala]|nr:hypothetical protein B0H13DRAFT_1858787 [Mycena leptocephala]